MSNRPMPNATLSDVTFNVSASTIHLTGSDGTQRVIHTSDLSDLVHRAKLAIELASVDPTVTINWSFAVFSYDPHELLSVQLELLESITEDDEFLRTYPRYESYQRDVQLAVGYDSPERESIGRSSYLFDCWLGKVSVDDAVHSWFVYEDSDQA